MINRSDYVQTNNKQKKFNLKISPQKKLIGFFFNISENRFILFDFVKQIINCVQHVYLH